MFNENEVSSYVENFDYMIHSNPDFREQLDNSYINQLIDQIDSLEYTLSVLRLQLLDITNSSARSTYSLVFATIEKKLEKLKNYQREINDWNDSDNSIIVFEIENIVNSIKEKIYTLERFFFTQNEQKIAS